MPVIAGRTREQLRQAIGYNCMGGEFFVGSTTSSSSDATSVFDTKLRGGDDSKNGRYIRLTSGSLDGQETRVSDYAQSTGDMTVAPAFTGNPASGVSYELWLPEFPPVLIEDFINQAIIDTYGRAYDPVEDISLHTGGDKSRFDVPSGISAISRIEARTRISSDEIHACESAFDESVDAQITATTDTEIKWRGNSSMKLTVSASAGGNDLITDSITSLDISGHTHVEFWCRSTVATSAADIHILLDDTASCASAVETLALPALTANTDTFVRIALSNPRSDTAIISVGVRFTVDKGASVFWIDDIQAVDENTSIWDTVSRQGWKIEKGTSDLLITQEARSDLGYVLLKLVGGDAPALLTSDAATCEIDDSYVIARATELALLSAVNSKPEYGQMARIWNDQVEKSKKGLHRLRGARKVQ